MSPQVCAVGAGRMPASLARSPGERHRLGQAARAAQAPRRAPPPRRARRGCHGGPRRARRARDRASRLAKAPRRGRAGRGRRCGSSSNAERVSSTDSGCISSPAISTASSRNMRARRRTRHRACRPLAERACAAPRIRRGRRRAAASPDRAPGSGEQHLRSVDPGIVAVLGGEIRGERGHRLVGPLARGDEQQHAVPLGVAPGERVARRGLSSSGHRILAAIEGQPRPERGREEIERTPGEHAPAARSGADAGSPLRNAIANASTAVSGGATPALTSEIAPARLASE
jgi:hypothetical protein